MILSVTNYFSPLCASFFPATRLFRYKKPKKLSNQNKYLHRVRKLSAILLISIFAFSQYARQLNYLQCKFSNNFKTSAAKCDCEKQAGFEKQDTGQLPVSKTHMHIQLDELFAVPKEVIVDASFKEVKLKTNLFPGDDECKGIYTKPWQPPNT